MSGKFQLADLEPPATAEKTQKNEESKEEEAKEEVQLNIPTEALPAGRAVNVFEKPSTNIFNTPTSEATSSKESENIFTQARTDKNFVNVFYNKASVNLFALK
jgi:siroheme synthase (precorrin-2 oxidase/ferrochelatase)